MPALATHYLCGNSVLKLMDDEKPDNPILKYRNVFNLGTQGPDILFYYGAWPHADAKTLSGLGNRMHEENTGAFIQEALKYVQCSGEAVKGILNAYLCGFLCHYILDCHTHPYIFYRTGFVRKGEDYNAKYTSYHRMFETALDVLMLKHELGTTPAGFKASPQIRIPSSAAAEIGNMYSEVLGKVYGVSVSNRTICDAIADIANISALLRDKTGIKKLFLTGIEKKLGKLPMFSSMILPIEITDGLDYLNTSHSAWYAPWNKSEAFTSSFIENYEAAVLESIKTIALVQLFLENKMGLESIAAVIGNRSYSTGRNCSLELEFEYFDCIYE